MKRPLLGMLLGLVDAGFLVAGWIAGAPEYYAGTAVFFAMACLKLSVRRT